METSTLVPVTNVLSRPALDRILLLFSGIAFIGGVAIVGWGLTQMQAAIDFDMSVPSEDFTKRIINSGLATDRLVKTIVAAVTTASGALMAGISAIVFALGAYSRR